MAQVPSNSLTYSNSEFSSAYDTILHHTPPSSYPFKNFNCYVNSFFLPHSLASVVVVKFGTHWGHYFLCYLRNLVAGLLVYYGTASIFHYHCYIHPRSIEIFEKRPRPTREVMIDQIKMAQASIFIYVFLPVISDYLIEENYTYTYYTIKEINGWAWYAIFTVLYFCIVEISIYWMHRTLHTNKFLYKHVHMLHHKYNRADTLTPWASIAFHPLDGMMQACPYVFTLFVIPCHYFTHIALLFATAIWATYIHDAMDWNVEPVMGSKYHTLHHTHYACNYGQVFTFCDAFWGTLRVPTGRTGVVQDSKKGSSMSKVVGRSERKALKTA